MARKEALLRLHSRLVKRRDALRKALSGDLDSLREYASTFDVGDSADAAIDTANDEISSQLAELESRELEQIENALRRIEKGVYGRCELCGGKIAEARLNALPYTSTCIDCQRESERTGMINARGQAYAPRWDKLDAAHRGDDHERDAEININDFEVDFSESGR
jgi:DnaK suppressor protein